MALSFRGKPDIWHLGLFVGGVQIQTVLGGSFYFKSSSSFGLACVSYNHNKLKEKLQAEQLRILDLGLGFSFITENYD